MSDSTTPSSRWAADGQRDPHGDRYACERAALALGNLTDDELANAVFLHGNEQPTMADMAAGKALAGIVYLTAAKDRIRWLSRALADAIAPKPADLAEQQGAGATDAEIDSRLNALHRHMKASGQHNGGMVGVAWDRAVYRAALAASQPWAQLPVGQVRTTVDGGFIAELFPDVADRVSNMAPLFASPPVQGIDPGQLRALAEQWKQLEYPFSYEGNHAQRATDACCADLLALIDQCDAAPGVDRG